MCMTCSCRHYDSENLLSIFVTGFVKTAKIKKKFFWLSLSMTPRLSIAQISKL